VSPYIIECGKTKGDDDAEMPISKLRLKVDFKGLLVAAIPEPFQFEVL
jgi:hypothetical protein